MLGIHVCKKPSKEDVSKSSPEIRESYKRYAELKSHSNKQHNEADPGKAKQKEDESSKENISKIDDGVFGKHLNKSLRKKSPEKICSIKHDETVSWRPKLKPLKRMTVSTPGKEDQLVLGQEEEPTDDLRQIPAETSLCRSEDFCGQSVKRKPLLKGVLKRPLSFGKYSSISEDIFDSCKKTLEKEASSLDTTKINESVEATFSDQFALANVNCGSTKSEKAQEACIESKNTKDILDKKRAVYTVEDLSNDKHLTASNTTDVDCVGKDQNQVKGDLQNHGESSNCDKKCVKNEDSTKNTHSVDAFDFVVASAEDEGKEEKKPKLRKKSEKQTTAASGKRKREDLKEEEEKVELDEKCKKVKLSKKAATKGKRLVSNNFVKIDLRKKTYVRGLKKLTGAQYKRQQWKHKTSFERYSSSSKKCFKCGEEGHWAKFCRGRKKKVDPFKKMDEEKNSMELEHLNQNKGSCFDHIGDQHSSEPNSMSNNKSQFTLEDVLKIEPCWPRKPFRSELEESKTEPLFQPDGNKPKADVYKKVKNALKVFGYDSFREGQHEAVTRIVSGLSTLVILATGSGKSLCYQLPAYMYFKERSSLTIVVSPLVALMQDQIAGLPSCLPGAFLNSHMTKLQQQKVVTKLKEGKIAVLLVSPEALVSGGFSTGILPPKSSLPPISFACIDEAHCLSEWSHNFRPSYLKVCKVLRERYNIDCLLGLTATASQTTANSVTQHLGIPCDGAIIRDPNPIPENLHITASRDENRDVALVELLQMEPFSECDSIIVYVTRRTEADRLAVLLRTSLPDRPVKKAEKNEEEKKKNNKKKGKTKKSAKPFWWNVESYHAGLTPAHRKRVQNQFMSGELRVVVATVAFGMGLDKSDVRSVIHFNMPKSFENFVQEIGRAGRDGKPSFCHAFLDDDGNDLNELRRHIHGNTVDRSAVKRFVELVFPSCKCYELNKQHTSSDENSHTNFQQFDFDSFNQSKQSLSESDLEMFFNEEIDEVMQSVDSKAVNMADDVGNDLVNERYDVGKDTIIAQNAVNTYDDVETDGETSCLEKDTGGDVGILSDISSEINNDPVVKQLESVGNFSEENESDLFSEKPLIHPSDELPSEQNEEKCSSPNVADFETDSSGVKHLSEKIANVDHLDYCSGHCITLPIDSTVQDLDMPEENITTLMSYLELHEKKWIEIMNPIRSSCCIKCYGGPEQFQLLARKFPPVALAIRCTEESSSKYLSEMRQIDLDLGNIADEMCWDIMTVAREVRALQWNMAYALDAPLNSTGKSGIVVECENLSFHLVTRENISDEDKDLICDFLFDNVVKQERTRLLQLNGLYNLLKELSCEHFWQLKSGERVDKKARENISRYFMCDENGQTEVLEELCNDDMKIYTPARRWNVISSDIRNLLVSHPDQDFPGRAVARILQGIGSPRYPAITYGRDRRFWRQYMDVDFNELRIFAVKEIANFRN